MNMTDEHNFEIFNTGIVSATIKCDHAGEIAGKLKNLIKLKNFTVDDLKRLEVHARKGDEYISVIDEFREAEFTCWPHVIVQSRHFQSNWAFKLLQRHRNTYIMFNNNVQGKAGVAIAGPLGAVKAQGRIMIDFPKLKVVVTDAGSAGIGVLNAVRETITRMLGNNPIAFEGARSQFGVVDAQGLITEERQNLNPEGQPFARKVKEINNQELREGASPVEVVREVKPDVPLGLSPVGELFRRELKAKYGSSYIRLKAANGVVVAAKKKLPSILVDGASVQKI